jgi:hypothetical protein
MSINPFKEKGVKLDKQFRTWKQIAQLPYRKQEVDAYTRCRVILMNGIENESIIFSHNMARKTVDKELKELLAIMRRVDSQQQTTIFFRFFLTRFYKRDFAGFPVPKSGEKI